MLWYEVVLLVCDNVFYIQATDVFAYDVDKPLTSGGGGVLSVQRKIKVLAH